MLTESPEIEARPLEAPERALPKVWGLDPVQLHDRFWAARGVQVVRQGERYEIVKGAELFLLTDPRTLVIFRLRDVVEQFSWTSLDVLTVRLHNVREAHYRERITSDEEGRFIRYTRLYGASDTRLARVAFTTDRHLAQRWQNADNVRGMWQRMRREIFPRHRSTLTLRGRVYDRDSAHEVNRFVRDLVGIWERPDVTIPEARQLGKGIWGAGETGPGPETTLIGPVWVGAGRRLEGELGVLGPAVLWDDRSLGFSSEKMEWQEIEPKDVLARPAVLRRKSTFYHVTKRIFDIAAALLGLLVTLPLYPIIMVAIFLEDGRPFFFGHVREAKGGREFKCWKFRSMRRDADRIKEELANNNQADGPQFFMKADPRMTRVGNFLRKRNLDELPQFWNVLVGEMSIVGPRPSPRAENQFCPPWRESRLSVPAGITGLWQVKRTRRHGMDFQEWIKFDMEYAERAGWALDIRILFETAFMLLWGNKTR